MVQIKAISTILSMLYLVGCTTTAEQFYQNPSAVETTSLCRGYLKSDDRKLAQDIGIELNRRGVYVQNCQNIVNRENAAIAAVAIAGVAVAACASSSSCRSGFAGSSGGARYQDADWDEFYDADFDLVWRCREIDTGRFTYDNNCSGKYKTDSRWPSKSRYL